MKIKRNVLAFVAATGITIAGVSGITWFIVKAQTPATKDFTIHYRETGTAPGDRVIDSYFSRRSDGATVDSRAVEYPDHKNHVQRTIEDPTSGVRVVLDEATDSKTTYKLSKRAIDSLKNTPRACLNDPQPQVEMRLQYRVERKLLDANPHHPVELWLAPELGCAVLEKRVYGYDADGKSVLRAKVEAVSVSVGEPDATLFGIPPSFEERSPSEVMAEFAKRFHVTVPNAGDNLAGADRVYRSVPQP